MATMVRRLGAVCASYGNLHHRAIPCFRIAIEATKLEAKADFRGACRLKNRLVAEAFKLQVQHFVGHQGFRKILDGRLAFFWDLFGR